MVVGEIIAGPSGERHPCLVLCWSTSLSGVTLLSGNDTRRRETEGLEWEIEFGVSKVEHGAFFFKS